MHESFEPHHEARHATPRAFGLMLAVVCVVIALLPIFSGHPPRSWLLAPAAAFALAAWRWPQVFAVPNRLWMKLGELLARVVAPLALALLYFGLFVPMGWLLRATGHDPLHLRRNRADASYWIERDPPGPRGDSLTHPF